MIFVLKKIVAAIWGISARDFCIHFLLCLAILLFLAIYIFSCSRTKLEAIIVNVCLFLRLERSFLRLDEALWVSVLEILFE